MKRFMQDTPTLCTDACAIAFEHASIEAKAKQLDVDLVPQGEVDPDAVARILAQPVIPSQLSDRTRLQLAQLAEQGAILALPIAAYVFADKPNSRHWRLESKLFDKRVKEVAKASPPVRMMLDHSHDAADRVGDWTSAEVEEIGGVKWMHAYGVIRKPSIQADYLRGNLDRFSVALGRHESPYKCSICGKEYRTSMGWLEPACAHWPGDSYDGQTCNMIVDGHFLEASFVSEGAVAGTRIGSLQDTEDETMIEQKENTEARDESAQAAAAEVVAKAAQELEIEKQARAKADAERIKLADEVRELTLAAYVQQRRIYPAEVEYYRKIWQDSGREAAEAQLALRPSLVLQVQEPAQAAQEPEPSKPARAALPELVASVQRAHRLGFLSKAYSQEDIQALGLDKLNWS